MQILYSYIRRELICRQVNTINRREMKKTTRNIEMIEFVLTHLKKKSDDNHKTSDFDSKRRRIRNDMSLKNVLVVAFVASFTFSCFINDKRLDKSNKFVSKKKIFKISNSKKKTKEKQRFDVDSNIFNIMSCSSN